LAHPHLHIIVPGGGFSLDGSRWISCRPDFSLPVQVLSRLFRRWCLQQLAAAHDAGRLQFFTVHAALADTRAFAAYLAPLHDAEWVVYDRVAIANSRLVAIDHEGVSFKWKDYRVDGPERIKVMTLAPEEFIRRFLIHVLPAGFHRIRHYGLLASSQRRQNIARARQLLNVPAPQPQPAPAENVPPADSASLRPCPCCSGRMFVIEVFARGRTPRYRATAPVRDMWIDTSWSLSSGHQLELPVACFVGSRPTTVRLEPAPRLPAVSLPPGRRSHLNTGPSTPPHTHHHPLKLLSSQRPAPLSRQAIPSNPHRPFAARPRIIPRGFLPKN
jgi:hypothetical protein